MKAAKHNLGTSTINRGRKQLGRAVGALLEQIESRRLMSATLYVDANSANVTLDVRPNGGIETVVGGVTTDYSAGQWGNVLCSDATNVTVKATVVPVSIETHGGLITFHSVHGMRDINAMVSVTAPDYQTRFKVAFDETGDLTPRTITMERINGNRVISGMAPGNIFIAQDFYVGQNPYPVANGGDISFITGSGADHLNIKHSAPNDVVNVSSFGGTDTVAVGGSPASGNYVGGEIHLTNAPSLTHLVIDDSAGNAGEVVLGGNGTLDSVWSYSSGFGNDPYCKLDYNVSDVSDVTVKHGDYTGVYVGRTDLPTTVIGSTVNDNGKVVIGGGDMSQIVQPLSISNPTGYDDIVIDDSQSQNAKLIQAYATTVTGLSPGTFSWNTADVASVEIDPAAVGGNAVIVRQTAVPTTVNCHSQYYGSYVPDTVTVSNGGSVQDIKGAVTVDGGASPGDNNGSLIIDDSADTTARGATLSTYDQGWSGSLTGLAPAAINFNAFIVSGGAVTIKGGSGGNTFTVADTPVPQYPIYTIPIIYLNTGTGADTVNVWKTAAGSTLNIEGQSGLDAVNVGNAGNSRWVQGAVNVSNALSYTALTVDDSAENFQRQITLDALPPLAGSTHPRGSITGIVIGAVNYVANDVGAVTIKGASGGNTVVINNTPVKTAGFVGGNTIILNTGSGLDNVTVKAIGAGTTLNIDGQNGSDQVLIGNNGSVQGIGGTVTVRNTSGYSTLTIDDSADAANRTVAFGVLTGVGDGDPLATITGLAPGVINFEANDVAPNPTINGGSGTNVYTITGTPTRLAIGLGGPTIVLNAGDGNDIVNVLGMGGGTGLTVNGQGGDDLVKVDYSTGAIAVTHTITVDGGSAGAVGNSLTVKGNAADLFAMTAGSINKGAAGHIGYSNVNALYLNTGTFNANADLNLPALVAQSINTKVSFNTSQTIGTLSVDGAYAVLAPGGTKSLTLNGLSISNSGRLDLADNGMTLNYGNGADPLATMRGYLSSGYDNGVWDGAGIMSASAYGDATHHTGIGYADSADGTAINPTANSIVFKYTLYGDANLDRQVDLTDFTYLAASFNGSPTPWTRGDFNYDGKTDLTDFTYLAANFNQSLPAAPVPAARPTTVASAVFSTVPVQDALNA